MSERSWIVVCVVLAFAYIAAVFWLNGQDWAPRYFSKDAVRDTIRELVRPECLR